MAIIDSLQKLEKLANDKVYVTYSTTGAGAISKATTISADYPSRAWKLVSLEVTFSSAPTTSQNLTVTLTNRGAGRPNTVLYTVDPSAASATSILKTWDNGMGLRREAGQEVTLAYTNTDTRTINADIVVEVL